MPKKVTTAKNKKNKAVEKEPVKQLDLHKPFDLTDVSDETLQSYVSYLEQMLIHPGWKLMTQVLEGNLQVLERQIISKRQILTNNVLSDQEVDSLRDQHEILTELMEKPQELINRYKKDKDIIQSPNYDPYSDIENTYGAAVMSANTT